MTSVKGQLILENGKVFTGQCFGARGQNMSAEIVFNTAMVGYPESLTDPSYKNQILVLTYPCIGNYGVPIDSHDMESGVQRFLESHSIQVAGVIIADYSHRDSHWNSHCSLDAWLQSQNIPGLYDVDTRELTKTIREYGVMRGQLITDSSQPIVSLTSTNLVDMVSTPTLRILNPGQEHNILVIDCGIKHNIIRRLLRYTDCTLTIVPYNHPFDYRPHHGIFISNGPGDPKDNMSLITRVKEILDAQVPIPIFGICLGHQILGLAAGANTEKMKYGNRGVNLPVIDLTTKRCYITSQNHGYALQTTSLPRQWYPYFMNANDFSNEGIIHQSLPYCGVQFHPEACCGPDDTDFLFDNFHKQITHHSPGRLAAPVAALNSSFIFYHQIRNREIHRVLLLGSGGLSIGQAGEFDYSGSQAIKALKEEHKEVLLINPNIATVQTSKNLADKIYYLSITPDNVEKIIAKDRPDAIMINFGGQTALNCALQLHDAGVFEQHGVRVLGTKIESVRVSEDRERFAQLMETIGEPIVKRFHITRFEDIPQAIETIHFPMILRNGFALGGLGSCFVSTRSELEDKVRQLLKSMPSILVEHSIKGWKEVEYEIVRDYADNCIAVCNMENFDPVGVHTGDSIVVAPSQTLSNSEYYRLRRSAIKIAKTLEIIGECNVQFALNPESEEYVVIELNPRLSRSSALASKATGYPLAYVAAKILLGKDLGELKNSVTKKTTACYEPSLDYVVVKIPKWEFLKFRHVNKLLDSSMKSVGEVMAIGRNFEETIQKAIRMVDDSSMGFHFNPRHTGVGTTATVGKHRNRDTPTAARKVYEKELNHQLEHPSHNRILYIAAAFSHGYTVDRVHDLTRIDRWFLHKLYNIHRHKQLMAERWTSDWNQPCVRSIVAQATTSSTVESLVESVLQAKKLGFSDRLLGSILHCTETDVQQFRHAHRVMPVVKQIDTTAGEFPAETNYLYLTYNGVAHDVPFDTHGVMVLGCGSYKIGSSVEFDWCAVSCVQTLKRNKIHSIVVNYNPETVSTDYDMSDRLYFEEISSEVISDIHRLEQSQGVIVSVGGQIPNNIAMQLHTLGVPILGTSPVDIDRAEDRHKFSQLLDTLGVDQPAWKELSTVADAVTFCNQVSYPVLLRPSYVLSGASMEVIENERHLTEYIHNSAKISNEYPVVITKFITGAKEIEIDAVADHGKLINYAISEHLENAGIHSGDATIILPAQKLYLETIKRIKQATKKIAQHLHISGPFNIQFMSKENEIKVIECNLRASRSFPFVSKTLDANFIHIATNIMINKKYTPAPIKIEDVEYVAIKVPVFSFNRLPNVDPVLGVEMVSTGEIASFGYNVKETYIKALLASGFRLPQENILLSLPTVSSHYELLRSFQVLESMGYTLLATPSTHEFLTEHQIKAERVTEEIALDRVEGGGVDLCLTLRRNPYVSHHHTPGFCLRRKCVDFNVPLLTNIKNIQLFVSGLKLYQSTPVDIVSYDEYTR